MGTVEYWWVKTPAGEEFGPITTSGIKRLINDGIITSADEIRQEDCEDYQVMDTCTHFSFGTQVSVTFLKPVEKTEILKTECEHTIMLRKKIEITAGDPTNVNPPNTEAESFSQGYTLAESTRYENSKLGKNIFFVVMVAACLTLVFLIVQKFSVTNNVKFNQASKAPKTQFPSKQMGKSKKARAPR
jgi:hypothetical protein